MAGASLEQFFAHYVRGRDELGPVYNEILAGAGVRLEEAGRAGRQTDGPVAVKAFLGADLEQSGDFILVPSVRAGSPAYEQGLDSREQITARYGRPGHQNSFEGFIAA